MYASRSELVTDQVTSSAYQQSRLRQDESQCTEKSSGGFKINILSSHLLSKHSGFISAFLSNRKRHRIPPGSG